MQKQYKRLPYIICYICAFAIGIKQIREPDIWWQLLTGRWMLDNGEVTRQDMFSYTMEGTEWINVKWLYEILIATIEKGIGPHGVMLLQAVVNIGIVYLLLRTLTHFAKHMGSKVSTLFATLATILFLAASEFRFSGRPEMMSHLFTALYIFILWRSDNYSWKSILWLIPLQCLWANMHEGYPVGMVIIALYIAGGFLSYLLSKNKTDLAAAGRLSAIWGGMALAILLNPNTIQLWKQPFEIFRQLKANKYTSELFSIAQPEYWTTYAYLNIAMLAAVCIFLIVWLLLRRRQAAPEKLSPLVLGYLLSVPVFGYLSTTALRNIPFTQIVIFPAIPVLLVWTVQSIRLHQKPVYGKLAASSIIISSVVAAAFYILIVSNSYYKFAGNPDRFGLHVSTLRNPTATADFIQRYNLKGPALADYFSSSYLLWRLYPDFKSYIDLRDLDIFPEEFFDEYFKMYNEPKKFQELDSSYKFNYIVMSTSQSVELIRDLYWGEGFNVVHIDPVCMILLRNSEENAAINRGPAAQHLFTWPQDPLDPTWAESLSKLLNPNYNYDEEDMGNMPLWAGKFYNRVGNSRIALKFLRSAVQTDFSGDADALTTIGNSYLGYVNFTKDPNEKRSAVDSARWFFERSLAVDENHMDTYIGLATVNFNRKDFLKAKHYLEEYIERYDKNDYVYYMQGLVCMQLAVNTNDAKYYADVIDAMKRSLHINPQNKKAYLFLTEAYRRIGNMDMAKQSFNNISEQKPQMMEFEEQLYNDLEKTL